jgi:hypothetical protein
MRYFETLIYIAGWAESGVSFEEFLLEVQRLAAARGLRAEAVQPVAESDETPSVGPLTMLRALPGEDAIANGSQG